MNRLPFVLSSIALATLAGCATESLITSPSAAGPAVGAAGTVGAQQASAGGTAVAASPGAGAVRAGFGRIESIQVVPTAATGRAASKTTSKRIAMRMEDGTMQYFDTTARVSVGDRIEITSNGTMRHFVI